MLKKLKWNSSDLCPLEVSLVMRHVYEHTNQINVDGEYVFGFFFVSQAVTAGLFFVGGWVFNSYKHFDEIAEANFTLIPASIIIAVGVLMFIVGIVACIAAFKENKCLLAVVNVHFFTFHNRNILAFDILLNSTHLSLPWFSLMFHYSSSSCIPRQTNN